MKVKMTVVCKYVVKKEVEFPEDIVRKLQERSRHTGTVGSDGELAEYLGEVVHEAEADDWEFEVLNIEER